MHTDGRLSRSPDRFTIFENSSAAVENTAEFFIKLQRGHILFTSWMSVLFYTSQTFVKTANK